MKTHEKKSNIPDWLLDSVETSGGLLSSPEVFEAPDGTFVVWAFKANAEFSPLFGIPNQDLAEQIAMQIDLAYREGGVS